MPLEVTPWANLESHRLQGLGFLDISLALAIPFMGFFHKLLNNES